MSAQEPYSLTSASTLIIPETVWKTGPAAQQLCPGIRTDANSHTAPLATMAGRSVPLDRTVSKLFESQHHCRGGLTQPATELTMDAPRDLDGRRSSRRWKRGMCQICHSVWRVHAPSGTKTFPTTVWLTWNENCASSFQALQSRVCLRPKCCLREWCARPSAATTSPAARRCGSGAASCRRRVRDSAGLGPSCACLLEGGARRGLRGSLWSSQ